MFKKLLLNIKAQSIYKAIGDLDSFTTDTFVVVVKHSGYVVKHVSFGEVFRSRQEYNYHVISIFKDGQWADDLLKTWKEYKQNEKQEIKDNWKPLERK